MDNLRHNIKVNIKEKWIRVDNVENENIKVEYVILPSNFCIYQSNNIKNGFSVCNYGDNQIIRVYICELYCGGLDFHIYDIFLDENDFRLDKIGKKENFDFYSPFILLTGHAGGGTSIVTKFLKVMGVNAGLDSGPLDARKPHEAMGIKSWVGGLSDRFPKHMHKENFLKVINSFGYNENQINLFKIPECNSQINLLLEILPNLKIVSVVKKQSKHFSTTEGSRFSKQDDIDLYRIQYPHIEGGSIFHLEFNRFFTDYSYVNKLLKFMGCINLLENNEQLEFIKNIIKFDSKSIE